jgi:hypothetical protein
MYWLEKVQELFGGEGYEIAISRLLYQRIRLHLLCDREGIVYVPLRCLRPAHALTTCAANSKCERRVALIQSHRDVLVKNGKLQEHVMERILPSVTSIMGERQHGSSDVLVHDGNGRLKALTIVFGVNSNMMVPVSMFNRSIKGRQHNIETVL